MAEFTVYGRPGCGYCVAATQLLKAKGYSYDYVDIYAQGISSVDLANIVGRPARTVPQILHGKTYVGGYTDLVPYLQTLITA
ncbi:MAG: glutaredoxin domain-containing protein [Porticoccaceae bacterium]|jgi:glutaredoxin 1